MLLFFVILKSRLLLTFKSQYLGVGIVTLIQNLNKSSVWKRKYSKCWHRFHVQEAVETAAQIIDGFSSFFHRRKSVEKTIHQKKNKGHRTSKIGKLSSQSYSNGHLPYITCRAHRCMSWCANLLAQ